MIVSNEGWLRTVLALATGVFRGSCKVKDLAPGTLLLKPTQEPLRSFLRETPLFQRFLMCVPSLSW